jgi:hypothetical protein
MLNCDVSEPRSEAGKLETFAPCEIKKQGGENLQRMHRQGIKEQVAEESGIRLVLREELIQFKGEGRDARSPPRFVPIAS